MAGEGRREVLKLAAAAALGAAGAAGAAAFQASRPPPQSQPPGQFDVVSYGADASGTSDSTAAIQRAIDDAARAGGGTVFFPAGTYACSRPLNADRSAGVQLLGMGAETVSAERVATLRYEGGGRAFISARSTAGFGISRLGVVYADAAFTGFVVDLSGTAAGDTAFARVENCVIQGAGQSGAGALLCLDRAIISTVTSCNLANARIAILGRTAEDRYSNAIQVRSCQFISTAAVPITNPGEAWLIEGCTFEPLRSGIAGGITCGLAARALSVIGCWMGDVGGTTGTWIEFQGRGLQVAGNVIGGSPNTVAIRMVGGDNAGIDIRGNAFETHAVGVDLGAGQLGVTILANSFSNVATPVAGRTTPTTTVQDDGLLAAGGSVTDRLLSAIQELDARLRHLESGLQQE